MTYFLIGFAILIVIIFILGGLTAKLSMREQHDEVLHAKLQRIRARVNPIATFFENAFWWIVALGVLYLLIISGSNYEG